MDNLPLADRPHAAFLSHAHVDKRAVVDAIYEWCRSHAGIDVWYDSEHFPTGLVSSELAKAIPRCRAAIIVLSESSIQSRWVEAEFNLADRQMKQFPDFQIVPIRIDNCIPPDPLQILKWIDMCERPFDAECATQLVEALHWHEARPDLAGLRQVYLARGNAPEQRRRCLDLVALLRRCGVRVVRDAPDQREMDLERLADLMRSCGGAVVVLPDDAASRTWRYVRQELTLARELRLPTLVISNAPPPTADQGAPDSPLVILTDADCAQPDILSSAAARFVDELEAPAKPAFCFYGHAFKGDHQSRRLYVRCIEAAAGVRCVTGDNLLGIDAKNDIVNMIRGATFAIFDISDEDGEVLVNTCIEAGVAWGAGIPFSLIARGPRRRAPFMFRNNIHYYDSELELVGLMRRLSRPHRRITQ